MTKRLKIIGWSSLAAILIAVLAITGYYVVINEPTTPTPPSTEEAEVTDKEIAEALEALIEENEAKEALRSTGEATATLDSVRDNGNEFAVATRKFNSIENKIEFEMVASLGDPQIGNSYIVFITDGPTSLRVGKLSKEVENTFALSATFTQDISKLNEVVVIESGNFEEDVLQGIFE